MQRTKATFEIDSKLHRKLKVEAAKAGGDMRDVVEQLLRDHFATPERKAKRKEGE